jgi:uncharacterized protein
MRTGAALIATALLALGTLSAHAASFDCAKASTDVERMICASGDLSALDETLAGYYRAAQDTLPGAKSCMQSDQRTWLAQTRNRCRDEACLKEAYLDRLSELDKVQPARRGGEPMALPVRPFLVGIIPPTDRKPDPVESDPAQAPMLAVTGRLQEGEGGFVLTAEGGRSYALMNWYVDPPVLDQMKSAMATLGASFTVRGFAGRNRASGQAYFEPRRCIFVYQTPG